jgi:hypothetical protein
MRVEITIEDSPLGVSIHSKGMPEGEITKEHFDAFTDAQVYAYAMMLHAQNTCRKMPGGRVMPILPKGKEWMQ